MLKKIIKTTATGLLAAAIALAFVALFIAASIQSQERSAAQYFREAERSGN